MHSTKCRSPSVHGHSGWVSLKLCQQPALFLPELVAVGVPIITQHLDGAGCSVKFQTRTAILLDREAGCYDRKATTSEIEQDMRVVVRLDTLRASLNQPFGNGNTRHRGDAAHRSEKSGERGEIIDTQIKKRAAAPFVK